MPARLALAFSLGARVAFFGGACCGAREGLGVIGPTVCARAASAKALNAKISAKVDQPPTRPHGVNRGKYLWTSILMASPQRRKWKTHGSPSQTPVEAHWN